MEFEGEQESEVKEEVFVLAPSDIEESGRVLTQSKTPGISSLSQTTHRSSGTEEFVVVLPTQESASESEFRRSTKQVTFSQEVESTSNLDHGDELQSISMEKSEQDDNDDANFAPVKLYRYLFWGKGKDSATSDMQDQAKEEQITISESQEFEEFPHYQHEDDVIEYAEEAEITSQENISRFSPRKLAGSVTSKLRGFLQPKQQEAEKVESSVDSNSAETATNETITIEIKQSADDETPTTEDESAELQENESAENLPVYLVGKFRDIFRPSRNDKETGQGTSQSQDETVEEIVESTEERIETGTGEIEDEKNQAEVEVEESEVRSMNVTERIRQFLQPKSGKKKDLDPSIKSETSELREEGDEEIVVMKMSSQEQQSSEMRSDEEVAMITSSTENVKQDSAENLPVFLADRFKGLFQMKRDDQSRLKVGTEQVDDSYHPNGEASDATEILPQDEGGEEGSSSTVRGKSISRNFAEGVTSRLKTLVKPRRHERSEQDASDSFSAEQAQTSEKGDKYQQAVDVGKDMNVGRESAENVSVFLAGKLKNVLKSSSDVKEATDDREATGSESTMMFTGQAEDGESDLTTISRGVTDDRGYEWKTVEVSRNLTQEGRYVMQESERDHREVEGSEQDDTPNTAEISGTDIETAGIDERYYIRTLSTVKEEDAGEEGEYGRTTTETLTYTTFEDMHKDFNPKISEEEKEFHLSEDQSYEYSGSPQVVTEDVVALETSTQEQMPMEIGGAFGKESIDSALGEEKTRHNGEDERLLKEKAADGKIIGRVEERYNDYSVDDQNGEIKFESEGQTETEVRFVSVAERVKEFQQRTAEDIKEMHPKAKSGPSGSETVVVEEITVSESTLQEQQPTETQQTDEKVEQTWRSLENVKQDSAQNLPVLLLDRFKGFFQTKRGKASEVNVAEENTQDLADSGEMATELDVDSHEEKNQDVKATPSTFTGGVTSRLRGLLQPRRTDKEESDLSESAEFSYTVGQLDTQSTTEHHQSSDVIVTEETDKSTVTTTENVDKESAINLPVFLAGKFRNIFKNSRDEKSADVSSPDEVVDGTAVTKSEAASDDVVSDTEVAKEVTESTENVDKESAENRTVFLAGKFKDALKSSRVKKSEPESSRIEAAQGLSMSMTEHDETADSDYGAGDEIRKSADDVEKESPTHSGEETNYLETDRYEKSELISPQDEEGKVEESLLTTTEFDEAGNETFITHDDTVGDEYEYEEAAASTTTIIAPMPEHESEDSSSVDRFRVYEEEASTTLSYGDSFDAKGSSQIEPLEEIENAGRGDSTTGELKPIVTEEISVIETSTEEQTPFEIQQQENVDFVSSSENDVKQDSAENLPVLLANRFKGIFNRKRDEGLDEKAPTTESSTEFRPVVAEEITVVETATVEQTPIQTQLTEDADDETSSESDVKQDSAQNLPVLLADRFKGIFNRKRDHPETDAVKTLDEGDTSNMQSREELIAEAKEVESDEGIVASTANKPSAARKFTDSVASTFQGLFQPKRRSKESGGTSADSTEPIVTVEGEEVTVNEVQPVSEEDDETTKVGATREVVDDESAENLPILLAGKFKNIFKSDQQANYDEKSADVYQTDSEKEEEAKTSGSSNVSDRIKKFFQPRRDQDKKGEDLGAESVIEIQPVVTEEITVVCTEEKTPLEMQQQKVDEGGIFSGRDFKHDSAQNFPVLFVDRFKSIFGRKREQNEAEILKEHDDDGDATKRQSQKDMFGDDRSSEKIGVDPDKETAASKSGEVSSDTVASKLQGLLPTQDEDKDGIAAATERLTEFGPIVTEEVTVVETSHEELTPMEIQRQENADFGISSESDVKQDSAQNLPVLLAGRFKGIFSRKRDDKVDVSPATRSELSGSNGIVTEEIVAMETSTQELTPTIIPLDGAGEEGVERRQSTKVDSRGYVSDFLAGDLGSSWQQEETEAQAGERDQTRSAMAMEELIQLVDASQTQPYRTIGQARDETFIEDTSVEKYDDEDSRVDRETIAERLRVLMESDLAIDPRLTSHESPTSAEENQQYANEEEIITSTKTATRSESPDLLLALGMTTKSDDTETYKDNLKSSESETTSNSLVDRIRLFFQPRRERLDHEEAKSTSSIDNEAEAVGVVESQPQEISETSHNEAVEIKESSSQNENKETAENFPLYLASRLTGFVQSTKTKKQRSEDSSAEEADVVEVTKIASDDHGVMARDESASYGEVTGEGVETEEIDEYSQDPHSKAVPVGVTERLRQFFQPRRETEDNEEAQASSSNANVQESNIVDETMEIVRSQPEFAELSQNEAIEGEETTSQQESKETAENLPLYLASRLTGILESAGFRKDQIEGSAQDEADDGEVTRWESSGRAGVISEGR